MLLGKILGGFRHLLLTAAVSRSSLEKLTSRRLHVVIKRDDVKVTRSTPTRDGQYQNSGHFGVKGPYNKSIWDLSAAKSAFLAK